MDTSPIIRFRINREIAEKAQQMATARGMELPDVMRMMLTRAVRTGDFSIDQTQDAPPKAASTDTAEVWAAPLWEPIKAGLDAEAALALLHLAIAQRSALLHEGLDSAAPDLVRLEKIRNERDEACVWLASFNLEDPLAVARVLAKYGTGLARKAPPAAPLEPPA